MVITAGWLSITDTGIFAGADIRRTSRSRFNCCTRPIIWDFIVFTSSSQANPDFTCKSNNTLPNFVKGYSTNVEKCSISEKYNRNSIACPRTKFGEMRRCNFCLKLLESLKHKTSVKYGPKVTFKCIWNSICSCRWAVCLHICLCVNQGSRVAQITTTETCNLHAHTDNSDHKPKTRSVYRVCNAGAIAAIVFTFTRGRHLNIAAGLLVSIYRGSILLRLNSPHL